MSYKYLSPNIIVCENFLPEDYVKEIYKDLLQNKKRFTPSVWHNKEKAMGTQSCKGEDFWITPKNAEQTPAIWGLSKYFFSKEFLEFISEKDTVFALLLNANVNFNVHCVTYSDGGSYDKHMDQFISLNGHKAKNFFTFNLTFQRSKDAQGGEVLLYDNDEVFEVDKFNNMLTIFPSYINHAVKEVRVKKGSKYKNNRFSMQFWVSLV